VYIIYGAGVDERNEKELEAFNQKGYKYMNWVQQDLRFPGFEDLLVDQEIAIQSKVFLGNSHSGVSKTILFGRCKNTDTKCNHSYRFGSRHSWKTSEYY